MAVFHMGEPDYDEAFDINDPTDGYMGQCGLQLNEPVGRNRDQAVALAGVALGQQRPRHPDEGADERRRVP